ncbi:PE-PGRS family protein [Streptomyces sp. DH-12]|uniref:PE-PGRS family protein n=1 Tax=Streptomyces sp. DH-12 TaxID=2072509 RepID=UPI001F533DAA|nr:PE-PGRS family protein [Streptomyces sp. DH-12]
MDSTETAGTRSAPGAPPAPEDLDAAVGILAQFIQRAPLTEAIAALEHGLDGADAAHAAQIAGKGGVDAGLLASALTVRESLGRINDLIHASGIMLALPHILEEGERISRRPSLGAGNDPGRPYDLETDRRVAEFKLARWRGADAMRKRQVFKDLTMLAADRSGRAADLFVIGPEPARFLNSSASTVGWALDRSPSALRTFESAFGSPDVPIREFTATHAAHVRITDLCDILPGAVTRLLQ